MQQVPEIFEDLMISELEKNMATTCIPCFKLIVTRACQSGYYQPGGPIFLCIDGEDNPWLPSQALRHLMLGCSQLDPVEGSAPERSLEVG